ncbi:hypothetical protein LX32DRAFT_656627 [Colletotrichum zoysiae]|uniref:Uncharacterized protein n=1 Tax=Colletotrichum zoysiae TaxID=1216348 RepID=A0AAD9H9H4_9PEZI|nr:hypothetical protein LX32DRAFT_656627 [Colletotrichum zoysiae]
MLMPLPTVIPLPTSNVTSLPSATSRVVTYSAPSPSGRDCAAEASNGELKVGELSRHGKDCVSVSSTACPFCPTPAICSNSLQTFQSSASVYRDDVAYTNKPDGWIVKREEVHRGPLATPSRRRTWAVVDVTGLDGTRGLRLERRSPCNVNDAGFVRQG